MVKYLDDYVNSNFRNSYRPPVQQTYKHNKVTATNTTLKTTTTEIPAKNIGPASVYTAGDNTLFKTYNSSGKINTYNSVVSGTISINTIKVQPQQEVKTENHVSNNVNKNTNEQKDNVSKVLENARTVSIVSDKGNSVKNALIYTKGYTNEGFDIKIKGDYAIIKGARGETAEYAGIKGTRYALKNAEKHPEVFKFIDFKVAAKEALDIKGIGAKLGYTGITLDAVNDIYKDIKNSESSTKIAADVITDVGTGVANMALSAAGGAAIAASLGSAVPVVGTIAAAGFSTFVEYGLENFKFNGKSVEENIKDGVQALIEGMVKNQKEVGEEYRKYIKSSIK